MMESPTQFAWSCANAGDFPPPMPTRKGAQRYGKDDVCWLCGGSTHGHGWPRRVALPDTFCDHNGASRLDSDTVCQACAATSSSEGWRQYAAAYPERNLWLWFPEKEGKKPRSFSWLYQSHIFRPGHHESPDRARWRQVLTDPPQPPFLAIMAINGKKQILFRGRISHGRDAFWVQADEQRILVRPGLFAECLHAFEDLYNHGFSKDSIVSGDYHTGQMAKVGLNKWRKLEEAIRPWREKEPTWMVLAHHCGQRDEKEMTENLCEAKEVAPAPKTEQKGQGSLF